VESRAARPAAGRPDAAEFERLLIGMAHASAGAPEDRDALVGIIRAAFSEVGLRDALAPQRGVRRRPPSAAVAESLKWLPHLGPLRGLRCCGGRPLEAIPHFVLG